MNMAGLADHGGVRTEPRARYISPETVAFISLDELLVWSGRDVLTSRQAQLLLLAADRAGQGGVRVFSAGDLSLLNNRGVSIVGTREVSAASSLSDSGLPVN